MILVHRARRNGRGDLASLEQTDLVQQDAGSLRFVLELPLASFKLGVLELIGTTGVEDGAIPQDAIHEPALFELKNFRGKRLAFVLVNGHARKYKRTVTSISRLLC
jgi:hypothetical protein